MDFCLIITAWKAKYLGCTLPEFAPNVYSLCVSFSFKGISQVLNLDGETFLKTVETLAAHWVSESQRDTDSIKGIGPYGNIFAFGPEVAGFCLASFNCYILTAVFTTIYKMSE